MALLSTCLALVKPVGMSAEDADAWLITAAREVSYLPCDILAEACREVRRTATHHGQIVPGIIREGEERYQNRRKIVGPRPLPPEQQIEYHRWAPTREELEALKAQAASNLKA